MLKEFCMIRQQFADMRKQTESSKLPWSAPQAEEWAMPSRIAEKPANFSLTQQLTYVKILDPPMLTKE